MELVSNAFCELSLAEEYEINGGSTLGDGLILVGAVVANFAPGPIGKVVGVAIAIIGYCHSQDL